ncbi:MAG: PH domain-containing protein [Clostridia bacterium]|nr:PH domain-containing protein [Clostridia bacterium]
MKDGKILWSDRKRTLFGLPWSFTKYTLTEEKLLIQTGILSIKEEDIQLYRITDLTLYKSFWQRIFGIGTIHCCSGDKTTPEFNIKNVKGPSQVKELLSQQIEERRDRKRISGREILSGIDDHDDDDYDDLDHGI